MSGKPPNCDDDVLDLLQSRGPAGVLELAEAMEVTRQAVLHHLKRLMAEGMVQRDRDGCGSPSHRYWLTEKGVQFHLAGGRRGNSPVEKPPPLNLDGPISDGDVLDLLRSWGPLEMPGLRHCAGDYLHGRTVSSYAAAGPKNDTI